MLHFYLECNTSHFLYQFHEYPPFLRLLRSVKYAKCISTCYIQKENLLLIDLLLNNTYCFQMYTEVFLPSFPVVSATSRV